MDHELETLVVRMAKENPGWGYDRIVGAVADLGYYLSGQTVGNILRRNGIVPAPERKHPTTWKAFIRAHLDVLAGTDCFTVEVLMLRGLVTFYALFFIHRETRKVEVAGTTVHPNEQWMKQIARNVTLDEWGFLEDCRYLLHERDRKFTQSFRLINESGRVTPVRLPARSPNLSAYAERWARSVKYECLSRLMLFGEASLRRALREYSDRYHGERNHQGMNNALLFPCAPAREARVNASVACRERSGGRLKYYHREAA